MANETTTIVAGWDATDRGRDALALAGVLAREQDAQVRVVHVYPHFELAQSPELIDEARRGAGTRLDDVPLELLGGAHAQLALTPAGSPAEGLHREAERHDAATVVVGSSRRGKRGHVLAGSVAERLLHGAPCPVAVAPGGYAGSAADAGLRLVAVAFDGSRESRAAVDHAVELCTRAEAVLRVISVSVELGMGFATAGTGMSFADVAVESREQWGRRLDELVAGLPAAIRADARLRSGQAVEEIADECAKGVDLLVVGSRGYGAIRRTLLGSVSAPLVRLAPCPVLVVPATAAGSVPAAADPEEVTA